MWMFCEMGFHQAGTRAKGSDLTPSVVDVL